MAASFLSSENRDDFSSIVGNLGDKIEEILTGLDGSNDRETSKEIISNFTKAALLEFRRKLFVIAVERLEEREYANEYLSECGPPEGTYSGQCRDDWALATRKSKPLIADDNVALARFIQRLDKEFPTHVLKVKASDKKKANKALPDEDPVCENIARTSESEQERRIENKCVDQGSVTEVDVIVDEAACVVVECAPEGRRVERFVIKELEPTKRVGDDEGEVPIDVVALKDASTSTKGLCVARTIATQTPAIFANQSARMDISDSSFNDSLVEATSARPKHTSSEKGSPADDRLAKWYEEEMFRLTKRCVRAEKKLDAIENEHTKELNEARAEQIAIRKDLDSFRVRMGEENETIRNTPIEEVRPPTQSRGGRPADAVHDQVTAGTWDSSKERRSIMTQNTQGEAVITKVTPAHVVQYTPAPDNRNIERGKGKRINPGNRDMPMLNMPGSSKPGSAATSRSASSERSKDSNSPTMAEVAKKGVNKMANARPGGKLVNPKDKGTFHGTIFARDNARPSTSTDRQQPNKQRIPDTGDGDTTNGPKRRRIGDSAGRTNAEKHSAVVVVDDGKCDTSSSDTESSESEGPEDADESLTTILTKYGWLKVKYGSNQPAKVKSKPEKAKSARRLKGSSDTEYKDLCLKNVSCTGFKSTKEVEEAVKNFCEDNNVFTIYQRVLAFRPGQTSVNLKLVVQASDVAKVCKKGFWPKSVGIRDWYDDKPTERVRFFNGKDGSDDSSS